jgi:hypothetical protein
MCFGAGMKSKVIPVFNHKEKGLENPEKNFAFFFEMHGEYAYTAAMSSRFATVSDTTS